MKDAGVVLLGPQRRAPTLHDVVETTAPEALRGGLIAVITAGWEERELEDRELAEHLRDRTVNLELYRRVEGAFAADPELFDAVRRRHDDVRRVQMLYRLRLGHAMDAARALLERRARDDAGRFVPEAIAEAIDAVRTLDREHLRRLTSIHGEFAARWRPTERSSIAGHRAEIARLIEQASVVCIAGGHVAILLNRMLMFDVAPLLTRKPIIAWSAGAMALAERVVVFHDSPPQGMGYAEVLEAGLGLVRDLVPLPHAQRRLRLEDRERVELFARRFGPATCVALDEGSRLEIDGSSWHAGPGTRRLVEDGTLAGMEER